MMSLRNVYSFTVFDFKQFCAAKSSKEIKTSEKKLFRLVPTELADEVHQFDAENFVHVLSDSVMYPLEVLVFPF